jgi:hypothetical protein
MGVGLAFAAIVSTFILRFAYSYSNKKRDKVSEDEVRNKYTEDEMLGKFDLRLPLLLLTSVKIWETRAHSTDTLYEGLKLGPDKRYPAVQITITIKVYLKRVLDGCCRHFDFN